MIYIALDTSVWIGLIRSDLQKELNHFEELCYWIENKYLTHITPENIIREWDMNKVKNAGELKKKIATYYSDFDRIFHGTSSVKSTSTKDILSREIEEKFKRVDIILRNLSEQAKENQRIYKTSIQKVTSYLAPNHIKDSLRDTLNIITLQDYLLQKKYKNCIFSSVNYKDFSESSKKKHKIHSDLLEDFRNANLEYIYCDEQPFGNKLFNVSLRPRLPSYQDHLKRLEMEEEEKELKEKRSYISRHSLTSDSDFLENIKYIDFVLRKELPTDFDKIIIGSLLKRHESYRKYFFRNILKDDMV